ncbi:response regulator [Desulfomicrobium sp. ZS1]|uniref:response regulator n=1 Tax=Desulfomicrobium sp. ZS1 TaxID=2952228 RepID=UPI0020B1B0EC|nr:response regulator [Desulfomicrobium sp. ZS1]UTF50848.1 response regulator [Desulfomicrobium sp. ZS1]
MSRSHIVIVDDEARFRDTMAKILEHKRFVVSLVENGDKALEFLETISPDVVLLDVRMPGLNGEEALPRILAMKPKTKVIILTGHGEERAARRAFKAGAFDYLCKPCDVGVLVARIYDAVRPVPEIRERERTIAELMIPIDEYTCVQASSTVREGIERLKIAAENFVSKGLVMECGHRAVLVFEGEELVGVLNMRNLIQALRPDYVAAAHGGTNHAVKYSGMFWQGLFNSRVCDLESRCVRDIMNPRSPVVDCEANLMQVADLLYEENRRRVAVERDGRIVGVVREQELFHEISRLVLQCS